MLKFEWTIEEAAAAHPDLYLDHCLVMAVNLMDRISRPSCVFDVSIKGFSIPALESDDSFKMSISWSNDLMLKSKRAQRTEQSRPMLERASIALTALVFGKVVANSEMRVTLQGERCDYWLPKLECALEISGTKSAAKISRRTTQKRKQVLANPLRWNGFVAICCFDSAKCSMELSFHAQSAQEEIPNEE